MNFYGALIIALSVSIDAFAVSVSGALCKSTMKRRICALNAALFFGLFQFIMPLFGGFIADFAAKFVNSAGHIIAFVLLLFVGGKMIFDALKKPDEDEKNNSCPVDGSDFFHWKNLFIPAIATSIDALAIGAGLAFAGRDVFFTAVWMGVVTAAVSACGVFLGASLRNWGHSRLLTFIGGTAIVLIGVKLLLKI